ncbi:undecaprenyl diphosphate synthase family protein [Streptomyces chartreusis]|uniref:undecaprenyl diphosphate synthase family protein n=1 Tax=Streptomyces chartreusis TaxID=1969 RepID=UPI00382CDA8C
MTDGTAGTTHPLGGALQAVADVAVFSWNTLHAAALAAVARPLPAPRSQSARPPCGSGPVPRHVACIMDGNGRWATRQGLMRHRGHKLGGDVAEAIVDTAAEMGIGWLSMYAFSTENWTRKPTEVNTIMRLIEKSIDNNLDRWHGQGLRVRYLGQPDPRIPTRWPHA